MRLSATYRGARRNAFRALRRLSEWSSMDHYAVSHRVMRWVTYKSPVTGLIVTERRLVARTQVIHETLRTASIPAGA